MNCPNCESKQTRVTVTSHREGYTIRYCRCLDCKHKFKTEEQLKYFMMGVDEAEGWLSYEIK